MAREIKQKIVLEGEQQYRQALKEAQRNLKTLQSAMKAETAEMDKNATAQQKAEAKQKSLNAQIREQEKIVKTCREQLEAVRAEYGDNEDAVAKYEQKLNAARLTLANMKNELGSIGTNMGSVAGKTAEGVTATKSLADALEKVGSAGENVSGTIEETFSGMMDRIQAVVGEIWSMVTETAAKADSWQDLAGYWGTDGATVQKYARAVESVNDSFDDLNATVSKLVLGGKEKKITELLGISRVNYSNNWDYAMAAMGRLSEMAAGGKDMTGIYESLFGEKRSQKVMDLVNDWGAIQEKLAGFSGDEGGFGMSSEDLQQMQQVQLMVSDIDAKIGAIRDKFAAGFAPLVLDIGTNVTGGLEGVNEFLNAGNEQERTAALEKIRKNVEDFCRKVGEAIKAGLEVLEKVGQELETSDDPVVRAIGGILSSLTESLAWMINNQEAVKGAFEAIFGAWLLGKLAAVAGKLGSIVADIKTIQAFQGWNIATGGGGTTKAVGGGLLGKVGTLLSSTGAKVLGGAGAFLATLFANYTNGHAVGEAGEIGPDDGTGIRPIVELTEEDIRRRWLKELESGPRADLDGTGETILKARQRGSLQERLAESQADRDETVREAVEDLFDAWRNFENGTDTEAEYDRAYDYFMEALGDNAGEVMAALIEGMDQDPGWLKKDDVPAAWWENIETALSGGMDDLLEVEESIEDALEGGATDPSVWQGAGGRTGQKDGLTAADVRSFQALPKDIQNSAEAGVRAGISGIAVTLDGYRVGSLVAPYVSEQIARDFFR